MERMEPDEPRPEQDFAEYSPDFSPLQLAVSSVLLVGGGVVADRTLSEGVAAVAGLLACVAYIAFALSAADGLNLLLANRGRKPRPFMFLHVMVMSFWLFGAYRMIVEWQFEPVIALGLVLNAVIFYVAFFAAGAVLMVLHFPWVALEWVLWAASRLFGRKT